MSPTNILELVLWPQTSRKHIEQTLQQIYLFAYLAIKNLRMCILFVLVNIYLYTSVLRIRASLARIRIRPVSIDSDLDPT